LTPAAPSNVPVAPAPVVSHHGEETEAEFEFSLDEDVFADGDEGVNPFASDETRKA
jgi:hypothetical protein